MMKEKTFSVKGMTGEDSVESVETALMNLHGIERALIDLNDGEAAIVYDDTTLDDNIIRMAIEDTGYAVTVMTDNESD